MMVINFIHLDIISAHFIVRIVGGVKINMLKFQKGIQINHRQGFDFL